jgi:decaprenylphospho-beta-D-ribofuranose 2-oxidase
MVDIVPTRTRECSPDTSAHPEREPAPTRRLLSGWGRTAPSSACLIRPDEPGPLAAFLSAKGCAEPEGAGELWPEHRREEGGAGVIARGLGRSYGDAAQCGGGTVVDTSNFDSIGPIDPVTGTVEVGGGASLDQLIHRSLPLGWFLPVSPGTRHVTIGGAIAADVHGKNHHHDGSFSSHVTSLTLVTPTGIRTVGPDTDSELFWTTAGGMGLTGVIVSASVRMIRVETSWMSVDSERFEDLDELMAAMERSDATYRYSVAWLDCSLRGRAVGRSVLTRGDHLPRRDLGSARLNAAIVVPRSPRFRVPAPAPRGLVNPAIVSAFNELWFRRFPPGESSALRPLSSFFYPLDGVGDWNLLYGRGGFVQYQFVVGPRDGEALRRAVLMARASKVPSSLAVMKRFGPGNPGPLSFPIEGWTLALDFAVGPPGLSSLLDGLDELVASVGGRVYLAKDSRLRPEFLAVMYPRVGELAAVRRRVDPHGVLRSDLSRRLGLTGEAR